MTTFFLTAFWTPTFHTFFYFYGFGSQKGAKMDDSSAGKLLNFLIDSHKVAKVGPEGGQGLQKDPKMEAKGTKMEPQGLPN